MRAFVVSVLVVAGLVAGLAGLASGQAHEQGFRELDYQGPFRVEMDRVIDGWRYNLRWREGPRSRRNGRFHLSDVHTPSATSTPSGLDCEREFGIEVRDFVRRFVRGQQLRTRDVRRGRDSRAFVGLLQVGDEDLSTVLLEKGYAVPYHDSRRNPQLRHWDCANNPGADQPAQESGVSAPAPSD